MIEKEEGEKIIKVSFFCILKSIYKVAVWSLMDDFENQELISLVPKRIFSWNFVCEIRWIVVHKFAFYLYMVPDVLTLFLWA